MTKKLNLTTLRARLERGGRYVAPNGTVVELSLSGFYSVRKEGLTKLYSTVREAWRAL